MTKQHLAKRPLAKTYLKTVIFGVLPSLVALFAASCGTETGNPKKPRGDDDAKPAFLASDRAVASDLIAAQADDVIASTAEEVRAVAGLKAERGGVTVTARCAADTGNGALVNVAIKGSDARTMIHRGYESKLTAEIDETKSLIWVQAGRTIPCDQDQSGVAVNWATADGLTLDVALGGKRTTAITRTGPRGTFKRQGQFAQSGSRHVSWVVDEARSDASTILLKKTVTSRIDRSFTTAPTGTDGSVSLATLIEVSAAKPMVVAVERDRETQAWRSKTIESGTVVSSQAEGSRLESTYSNLKFTIDSGCAPESGAVIGAIYGSSVAPLVQFRVDFNQGEGTITYADGTHAPYVADYCQMDDVLPVSSR